MKVNVDTKNKTVTITMPINPKASSTGKTTLLASTRGGVHTTEQYEGKPVTVNLNVYVPAE